MKFNLRLTYLYLVTLIGLIILTIGAIQLVNLGFKTFIFRDVDNYEIYSYPKSPDGMPAVNIEEQRNNQLLQTKRQRERELINSISLIIIGGPLYFYHWKIVQKESRT